MVIAILAGAVAGCATAPVEPTVPESGGVDRERAVEETPAAPGSAGTPQPGTPDAFEPPPAPPEPPLTARASLGRYDARRDASLRLVITGLEADSLGEGARALASYQRAVRLDATNPIAFLALARHHVAAGNPEEASAFLDQARALFDAEGERGSAVDVWGIGLRAWIDRAEGRDAEADSRFEAARQLSPEIWHDELLSADELK
ncbi:MAG: tetratricopeptide repeat protein [Myxococcota bacterium]